jgi:hypothetical protein
MTDVHDLSDLDLLIRSRLSNGTNLGVFVILA